VAEHHLENVIRISAGRKLYF